MVLKTVIWTYVRGALAAGNDLEQRVCTVAEAEVFCGGWVLLVPQRYLFPYNQAWPASGARSARGTHVSVARRLYATEVWHAGTLLRPGLRRWLVGPDPVRWSDPARW